MFVIGCFSHAPQVRRSPVFGATPLGEGLVEFRVWAPRATRVSVLGQRLVPEEDGSFAGCVEAKPGEDYRYELDDGAVWPDPCSRYQPEGVRGPSRVVDTRAFDIRPGPGLTLAELVVYELHIGAFTADGTFDGAVPHLAALREGGITAIELMPVATFPGNRGWGYDGLYTWAPHPAYGGPAGLARLVDAAHEAGLGVLLDVVYNHVGPGDEALAAFGPYFTTRHETFWGKAIDYTQRPVREWAIQNAEQWVRDYRIDGLRLDAVHAIFDDESPVHVMRELNDRVKSIAPGTIVISEMAVNDHRPTETWGHDAQWADALHHELHALLTGEREGYYADYGTVEGLKRELERTGPRFVGCVQNHDQVGNRAAGDRLTPAQDRLALTTVLFSRDTPLVFMGEEYGETRPFRFFTDHIDPAIAEATREGRKREFAAWTSFSGEGVPDPQAVETFECSQLRPRPAERWFRHAVALRAKLPPELAVEILGERRVAIHRGPYSLTLDFDAVTAELSGP
jgi:maltooligosyltrehalose trehalohydrolase